MSFKFSQGERFVIEKDMQDLTTRRAVVRQGVLRLGSCGACLASAVAKAKADKREAVVSRADDEAGESIGNALERKHMGGQG
jgi:hypothetical protein